MAKIEHNEAINRLIVAIWRSLVQYAGECWPWTSNDAVAERDEVAGIVEKQHQHIRLLAEWLAQNDWAIDFGVYPTEYTSLHYVSLDYLLKQLVENEASIVADLEQARTTLAGDESAIKLVDQVLTGERVNLQKLRKLADSQANPQADPQPALN